MSLTKNPKHSSLLCRRGRNSWCIWTPSSSEDPSHPHTGVWRWGKLRSTEKFHGEFGLVLEDGPDHTMDAGYPKQQNGGPVPGAP